jgi:hypothetical protein
VCRVVPKTFALPLKKNLRVFLKIFSNIPLFKEKLSIIIEIIHENKEKLFA